jgi:hypothetical protein
MDMWQASFAIQLNTQTQEMQMQLYRLLTLHGSKVNPLPALFTEKVTLTFM